MDSDGLERGDVVFPEELPTLIRSRSDSTSDAPYELDPAPCSDEIDVRMQDIQDSIVTVVSTLDEAILNEPPKSDGPHYKLIFGDLTILPACAAAFVLAAGMFILANVVMPLGVYNEFFGTVSGYIALIAVYLSVYFSNTPDLATPFKPNPLWGSFRLFVAIGGGLLYTLFLQAVHRFFFGITSRTAITRGLYGLMPPHFILAALDLDVFSGFFMRQLHVPFLAQPVVWALVAIELFIHIYVISPALDDGDSFQTRAAAMNTIHIVYLFIVVLCGRFTRALVRKVLVRGTSRVKLGLAIIGVWFGISVVVYEFVYIILLELLPDTFTMNDIGYLLRCVVTGFFPALMAMSYYMDSDRQMANRLSVLVTVLVTVGLGFTNLAVYFLTVAPVVKFIRGDTGPWYFSDTITWNFLVGTVLHCWASCYNHAGLTKKDAR
ncbi:hypothetical protein J8273_1063 [Carpediemonas membranifera]|uniref:Uncharacterized protein n=1 Tax=Carpediemonas membranifera TaxID=201153 RepID=A0A8J6BBA1_9EUKA|nr:hypothetical protein J8273_1063 [Carpediemonas membranifera]|eukprot:KAG9397154.1 hypothetical protein J8273_1063 [Carpediemonas membranifera]